jgi:hypothetical protein
MSGSLSTTKVISDSIMYPYGTSEQFPLMEDSDLNELTESAHYYMECSNKGTCDRSIGECVCYEGYSGVACQRASCPNSCSGNGICKSKKQLASNDNSNTYVLWDKDITMGCQCDPGFFGPDCSLRSCKHGVDPLYLDDSTTIKYSVYDFATLTTSATIDFTDGTPQGGQGKWSIKLFDVFGEDWITQPILSGASCAEVIDALENLPNNVVPTGSVKCTKTSKTHQPENDWKGWDSLHPLGSQHSYPISYNLSIWEAETSANDGELSPKNSITTFEGSYPVSTTTSISGYIYRIKFSGNPGAIEEPKIELYLDGERPSLVSTSGKVITKVWTDGQQGENIDYFADHCDNVAFSIGFASNEYFLNDLTTTEKALLKTCLGDADFDTSNNIGVYNWDTGNENYPHFVKLVRSVSAYQDGGYYSAIWFDSSVSLDNSGDSTSGTFRLVNPFNPPDFIPTDQYEIYTTKGTLALTSNHSEVTVSFASKYFYTTNVSYDTGGQSFDGDISCELTSSNSGKFQYISHCLNKTDLFTILNFDSPTSNPPHLNIYKAARIFTQDNLWSVKDRFGGVSTSEMQYMTHVIKSDISSNWGVAVSQGISNNPFRIYKFFPSTSSSYNYVNECSNRGICSRDTGLCTCFPGYTNDDCSIQNSIAL